MTVTGKVKNVALQTITGFDVETRFDCTDKVCQSHVDLTLAHLEESEFSFTVEPDIHEAGQGTTTVTITRLNEGDDENPDDNTQSRTFDIVTEDFARRVLLEEFTTEMCSNCPRVATFLHNILDDEYYRENVVAVCHHSAYFTDWLTIPSDNDLLWYFNNGGSTYAPAMMLDRWTTDPSAATPVFIPNSQSDLKSAIDYCLRQPAFVSVNIQAKLDTEENMVNVLVQGSRSKENITVNPPRITVWLVEDNIKARSQAGAGNDWTHQHTGRAINKTWGDIITWQDGDAYTYECQFRVRSDYKTDDLVVCAMIYDYDEDVARNIVCNANQAPVTKGEIIGSAVRETGSVTTEAPRIYDLQGRRVTEGQARGIVILRRADGNVRRALFR